MSLLSFPTISLLGLLRSDPRRINFTRLSYSATLPTYATDGAAGMDLYADEHMTVPVLGHRLIKTNVGIELPDGFEGQVRARSGLANKHGVTVLNAPGTIDPDYTGGIGVILFNGGDQVFHVEPGDRIAQLVIARFERVTAGWIGEEIADVAPVAVRGAGGFGSTGTGALAAAGVAVAVLAPNVSPASDMIPGGDYYAVERISLRNAVLEGDLSLLGHPVATQMHAGSNVISLKAFEDKLKLEIEDELKLQGFA